MMDCKRALEETERRHRGGGASSCASAASRSAAKRAGRETPEGMVGYRASPTTATGTMVAVGCETEPVSKNEEFLAFAKKVLEAVDAAAPGADGLEEERQELARASSARTSSSPAPRASRPWTAESIAAYVHPPANKIGVLVQMRGGVGGARAQARDAHRRVRRRGGSGATTSPRRSSPPSARSTPTPTRCCRSRSRRVRRSSKGC